jgi:hypothetical protein
MSAGATAIQVVPMARALGGGCEAPSPAESSQRRYAQFTSPIS